MAPFGIRGFFSIATASDWTGLHWGCNFCISASRDGREMKGGKEGHKWVDGWMT